MRARRAAWVVTLGLLLLTRAVAPDAQSSQTARTRRIVAILTVEDARAARSGDVQLLLTEARAADAEIRNIAIRALGRLERREVTSDLISLLTAQATRAEAANAVVQSLRGRPVEGIPGGQYEQAVFDALMMAGSSELASPTPIALDAVARSIGRFPYARLDHLKSAEEFLRQALDKRVSRLPCASPGVGRGLESLARLNRKLGTLDERTIEKLREVARDIGVVCMLSRRNAMAALVSAQGVDADTLKSALADVDEETRRLGVLTLLGGGSILADDDRVVAIQALMSDASPMIRYEAVRAWTRRAAPTHGCQPLLEALSDRSPHVVLAAIDALGDQCRGEPSITDRIVSEARTPPPRGRWQREAHAFVALAKRDRQRAAIGMLSFATHNVWQVRMYAARAAAIVEDVPVLERLAIDPDANVADAALPALRQKSGPASDRVFIEVFRRTNRVIATNVLDRPYQLIRTAARLLEGARPTAALLEAMGSALTRITLERCETSRDARLALIERIGELGSTKQEPVLRPLLEDFDPVVAGAAAAVLTTWTNKPVAADPEAYGPRTLPDGVANSTRTRALFEMDNGRQFSVDLASTTPLTRTRFLALMNSGYYNGLTFHRVVPNFVIQGGSPGANEYCGDCPFMRDEVGLMENRRGTVGISTRGRDTGDAQLYINMVDNARLDHEYTVFGHVCGDGMEVVDEIVEGDRIARVTLSSSTRACGPD
jgi:cyclophilin family peptidyl-prolyl cis-trans isomerase/HEAT repeat protein